MTGIEPELPTSCMCYAAPSPLAFGYRRLRQQHFKLSVVKLNGSSFEVEVAMTATVGELKRAVEDVFSHSLQDDQPRISWSHVWGQFCLCYEGQKLVKNREFIRHFGIKDGDKLHFVRLSAMDQKQATRRSEKLNAAYEDLMVSHVEWH